MKISKLNLIFILEVVFFGLVVTGILPRSTVPYFVAALAVYVLFASLENATIFFIRSIPFFIAIPITETFDNFNTWRILSVIIFLKWFFLERPALKKYLSVPLLLLLLTALLSIIPAPDKILAVKRIIYFLNLSLIGFVIYDLAKRELFTERLIKNIAIPVIVVALLGFVQLISTYFIDIYQFMGIWGEGIQCIQFGNQWCTIAVELGNTWFAYYGEQLSLRVFSLFPDSHSFPQFLLLGLPSIFVLGLARLIKENRNSFRAMFNARGKIIIIFAPLVFLAAILSGTRGIWAAVVGVLLLAGIILYCLSRSRLYEQRRIFAYLSSYLISFFLLFAIAFPIFSSPQFLLSKGDSSLFKKRVRSIIDFGETSNSQRIQIWKDSLVSIKARPLLGVGIGNFPVVLKQKLELARAGSSAHNIYLHIAAEMGIPALLFALWFLWQLMWKMYNNFISSKNIRISIYNASTLLFIPWVLIYSLTDVALFDERAFLLFVATIALIFSHGKQ